MIRHLLVALLVIAAVQARPARARWTREGCPPPVPGYKPADVLAAMLSVHAHARWSDEELGSLKLVPLPLASAIKTLRCDVRPGATSRRRRAIGVLGGYSHLGLRFDKEIRALGGDPPQILAAIRKAHRATFPVILGDPTLLQLTIDNLEYAVVGQPTPSDKCEAGIQKEVKDSVVDKKTTIVLSTTISVPTSLNTVSANIDPRRWDECSYLWNPPPDATHLTMLQGNAPVKVGTCQAAQDTSPAPAIGEDIAPPRPMYEHFAFASGGVSASFDNVLMIGVLTAPNLFSVPVHRVDYTLFDRGSGNTGFLCGKISGVKTKVIVDQGHLSAWEESGRTWVAFRKEVEYNLSAATALAQVVVAHHELADELGDIVCCLK